MLTFSSRIRSLTIDKAHHVNTNNGTLTTIREKAYFQAIFEKRLFAFPFLNYTLGNTADDGNLEPEVAEESRVKLIKA